MSFDLEKKFIIATLLGIFLLLASVAVFYFTGTDEANFEVRSSVVREKITKKEADMEPEEEERVAVKILFGGDMMFDRYIRTVADAKGFDYVVEDLKPTLESVDFVVANLEGPITDNESVSQQSEFESRENLIFTFPKDTANELKKYNISVVNIGNNHVLNFGQAGLEQTRDSLQKAGIKYFGDPKDEAYRSYIKEYNNIKIGLVCYNQFSNEGLQKALGDIEVVKEESDVVVVYAHWGKEYESHSSEFQQACAHDFIDAGADLIIGSHPHVVQETEEYRGKSIYYSLGNFVFDQYFEDATKKGMLVEATIDKNKDISLKEIAIEMNNSGRTTLVEK